MTSRLCDCAARLDRIERLLATMNATEAERRLLIEIAQQTRGTTFSVAELIRHAATAPALHASLLEVCGCHQTAKRVGKFLSRLAGHSVAGVSVVRVGEENGAALWVCSFKPLSPVAMNGAIDEHADIVRSES